MDAKQLLYQQAKEAYYQGEPIMSDADFDALEEELGLTNKGPIGTFHKASYTIKHPFKMGSLSKVQIKRQADGSIPFDTYWEEVKSYLRKAEHSGSILYFYEATPKYDGCSFEVVMDPAGRIVSVSTRGDGEYGRDISPWFENQKHHFVIRPWLERMPLERRKHLTQLVVRGEVLVKKSTFREKYSEDFTIPRSFVAGVLGTDWTGTPEQIAMRDDLDWVCYDYREVFEDGSVVPVDYEQGFVGNPNPFKRIRKIDGETLEHLYYVFDEYRHGGMCPYDLDGFVLKPCPEFRLKDTDRERPLDCVAVKFLPEIVQTTIKDISWKVGKSGEYYPTAICDEVILGGKKVSRVSLHNYDYVVTNQCGVGAVLEVSLAGDIIPFVYSVVYESAAIPIPEDATVMSDPRSSCMHLMGIMSDEKWMHIEYMNSIKVLKIDGIGEKVGEYLWEKVCPVQNILEFMSPAGLGKLRLCLEPSKSTTNIIEGLIQRKKTLTLADVIEACWIPNCGPKNSQWLAQKLSGLPVSDSGVPKTIIDLLAAYQTPTPGNLPPTTEVARLQYAMDMRKVLQVPYLKSLPVSTKIPVILTGEPSNTSYGTKKEWLEAHPQYEVTSVWKNCKILFTNDLNAQTSKMAKAEKNGVEIRLYEE